MKILMITVSFSQRKSVSLQTVKLGMRENNHLGNENVESEKFKSIRGINKHFQMVIAEKNVRF